MLTIRFSQRFCYDDGRTSRYVCNMHARQSEIRLKLFNFTRYNDGFINKCAQLNGQNRMQLIWRCVREQISGYDLVYNESNDRRPMSFNKSTPFYLDCLRLHGAPSCAQVELKRALSIGVKSKPDDSEFVVYVQKSQIRSEFSLRVGRAVECWLTLFCLLFGLNLMDLIRGVLSFLLRKLRSRYRRSFVALFVLLYTALICYLNVRRLLNVDFQAAESNRITRPMLENDNLTIYICFDYLKILKIKESCFEARQKCSLKQKIDALWDRTDFLSNAEFTVQSEYIPVSESDVTEYYFQKRKCFKYSLRRPTILFFGALVRNVKLEIRLTVPYLKFLMYADDQLANFKDVRSTEHLIYSKSIYLKDTQCVEDFAREYGCTDRDDCVTACWVNEYANKHNVLPMNLPINPEQLRNASYIHLKHTGIFPRSAKSEYPQCNFNFSEKCARQTIFPSVDKINNNQSFIQINLNPDLTTDTKVIKNSPLSIAIEQLPMLFIWFHISITHLFKFLARPLRRYLQRIQSLAGLIKFVLFVLFMVNLKLHLDSIIYQGLKAKVYSDVGEKIGLPKLQFCVELDFSVDLKTGHELEALTPNSSNLFNEIILLRDNLTFENLLEKPSEQLKQLMKIFYFENSKCVELNLANFFIRSDTLKVKVASSVLDLTLDNQANDGKMNVFIQAYNFLNFNRALSIRRNLFYSISYTTARLIRYDRFYFLKKPIFFYYLLTNQNTRNEQHDYFSYLLDTFYEETGLTTTHLPLESKYFHCTIDNRQFIDFIHLRTLSSVLNDWTLDANSDSEYYVFDYTLEDLESTTSADRSNLSVISLYPNVMIDFYVEESRFDELTVTLNLLSVTVFWFNLNLIKLPSFLRSSLAACLKCLKHLTTLFVLLWFGLRQLVEKLVGFLQCRDQAF